MLWFRTIYELPFSKKCTKNYHSAADILEEDEKTVEEPFNKVKGDIRYRLRQAAKDAEMERLLSEVEIEE